MSDPLRVDKWLWAARLTKTRALAAEAADGGRVTINGVRAKPSKEVRPGDRLELTIGPLRHELVIRDTAKRRGPAKEAVLLYEETPESVARREELAALRRMDQPVARDRGGRPTKRDRRRFEADREARRRED